MIEQALESGAANVLFGVIVLGIFAALMLMALFLGLAIQYTFRRIRRWFVENVLLPKAEAEHNSFRKV